MPGCIWSPQPLFRLPNPGHFHMLSLFFLAPRVSFHFSLSPQLQPFFNRPLPRLVCLATQKRKNQQPVPASRLKDTDWNGPPLSISHLPPNICSVTL